MVDAGGGRSSGAPRARLSPGACSAVWDEAGGSALGSAAPARFWLAVEQNGPWGRYAATGSHLPRGLGAELEIACAQAGGRLVLLRRPGDHPDLPHEARHCYLAYAGGRGRPAWLLQTAAVDPAALLSLDLAALARGDADSVRAGTPGLTPAEPVLLVCTNGRRDVCCAVRGRPVAAAASEAYPGRVWECSHTGGHRFSPTGVLLPWGRTVARLDAQAAAETLGAAGRRAFPLAMTGPYHDRGWSAVAPRLQAAESLVRETIGEPDLDALWVAAVDEESVAVTHRDGRRWVVDVTVRHGEPLRNSCGAVPLPVRAWEPRIRAEGA